MGEQRTRAQSFRPASTPNNEQNSQHNQQGPPFSKTRDVTSECRSVMQCSDGSKVIGRTRGESKNFTYPCISGALLAADGDSAPSLRLSPALGVRRPARSTAYTSSRRMPSCAGYLNSQSRHIIVGSTPAPAPVCQFVPSLETTDLTLTYCAFQASTTATTTWRAPPPSRHTQGSTGPSMP